MLYSQNQLLINDKMNELDKILNKIYLTDSDKYELLKEKLEDIRKKTIKLAVGNVDLNLVLEDDSKGIINLLDCLIDEANEVLNDMQIKRMEDNGISELEELKELVQDFKKSRYSNIEKEVFARKILKIILKLADERIIGVSDIEQFYDCFSVQTLQNEMFEYKKNKLDNENLRKFYYTINKYNQSEDMKMLFNIFLGLRNVEEEEVDNTNVIYPTAYKKSTSKLLNELCDVTYGDNISKFEKFKIKLNNMNANTGMFSIAYTLFTRSKGVISMNEKKFMTLDHDHPFFDDIIGCIIEGGNSGYEYMKNLKFLYILDNSSSGASLILDNIKNIEYIYVKTISANYYFKTELSNLKEFHYERSSGSFSSEKFRKYCSGDYKIVHEDQKVLRKIYNE